MPQAAGRDWEKISAIHFFIDHHLHDPYHFRKWLLAYSSGGRQGGIMRGFTAKSAVILFTFLAIISLLAGCYETLYSIVAKFEGGSYKGSRKCLLECWTNLTAVKRATGESIEQFIGSSFQYDISCDEFAAVSQIETGTPILNIGEAQRYLFDGIRDEVFGDAKLQVVCESTRKDEGAFQNYYFGNRFLVKVFPFEILIRLYPLYIGTGDIREINPDFIDAYNAYSECNSQNELYDQFCGPETEEPNCDYLNSLLKPKNQCTVCGNGNLENGETCDDANKRDEVYCAKQESCCNSECSGFVGQYCGDGVVQEEAEECDQGEANVSECPYPNVWSSSYCSDGCKALECPVAYCGDGKQDYDELCDGPDGCPEGKSCSNDCSACLGISVGDCGDGIIQVGEACEFSNECPPNDPEVPGSACINCQCSETCEQNADCNDNDSNTVDLCDGGCYHISESSI